MNNLNKYIQEKLKISSKSKINKAIHDNEYNFYIHKITGNYAVDKILCCWGFEDNIDKEALIVIEDWVNDNNVDDVQPAADLETINEIEDNTLLIPKPILDLYDTKSSMNEECQYRLGSAKSVYTFSKYEEIFAAPDVIALVGSSGTLYCLPTYTL